MMANCFYIFSGPPHSAEENAACDRVTSALCYNLPSVILIKVLVFQFIRLLYRRWQLTGRRQTTTPPSTKNLTGADLSVDTRTSAAEVNRHNQHVSRWLVALDWLLILSTLTLCALSAYELYESVHLNKTADGFWPYQVIIYGAVQLCASVITVFLVYQTRLARHITILPMKNFPLPLMIKRSSLFLYFLIAALCRAILLSNFVVVPQNTTNSILIIQWCTLSILVILTLACGLMPQAILVKICDESKKRLPSPVIAASPLSQLTFAWLTPLMYRGWLRPAANPLRADDLWQVEAEQTCSILYDQKFRPAWERELLKSRPSLVRALLSMVALRYIFGIALVLVSIVFKFATPLLLKALLGSLDESDDKMTNYLSRQRIILSLLLFLATCMQSLTEMHVQWIFNVFGYSWAKVITLAVYEKALRLNNNDVRQQEAGDNSKKKSETGNKTIGQLINLISVDSQRFQQFGVMSYFIFNAPITMVVSIVLIWRELGWATLAGVAVLCIFIPFNAFISSRQKRYFGAQLKLKDERLRQMSEMLNGIRLLKLYAWEVPFISRLSTVRNEELRLLRIASLVQALASMLWTTCSFFVLLATFAAFVLASSQNILTPQKTFVALALFNLLRQPMNMLSQMVQFGVQFRVSLKRIFSLLTSEEKPKQFLPKQLPYDETLPAVEIDNGNFSWVRQVDNSTLLDNDREKLLKNSSATLRNIQLKIQPKTLTAIVGQVGAGKSSLCAAILGQMNEAGYVGHSSSVTVRGTTSYVPQQAWIQNMTLRENITFVTAFEQKTYENVLDACALRSDVNMLAAGDTTEIGEKGLNLSGGQKQRVSLARAAYSNAQIVLLDDPLSAVDEHVSRHIFTNLLSSETGLLRHTTRIMATHNIHLLPFVDNIIVMQDGTISASGSYNELLQAGGAFSEFLSQRVASPTRAEENGGDTTIKSPQNELPINETEKSSTLPDAGQKKKNGAKLIENEEAKGGRVSRAVYWQYAKYMTLPIALLVLVFAIGHCALLTASQIWLAIWSSDAALTASDQQASRLSTYRLLIYAALGSSDAFLILLQTATFAFGAQLASRSVHELVLDRIMHAPVGFFDTTPSGRILNRFSRDIDSMDSEIPYTFRDWFDAVLNIAVMLVIVVYGSSPWFLLAIIPLGCMYIIVQQFAVTTVTQIRRIESTQRSPMISHFSETLQGLPVILAWNAEKQFTRKFEHLNDEATLSQYWFIASNRWINVTLQFVGSLIVLSASLFAVTQVNSTTTSNITSSSAVGLVVSNALAITASLTLLVRIMSLLENAVVSVERLREYSQVVQERDREPPTTNAAKKTVSGATSVENSNEIAGWPENGNVEFSNYSAKYRPELEQLVLRNINIKIDDAEKVGIVGRTGAGKSSMALALFRMLDSVVDGSVITVAGRKISDLNLFTLRSNLSIIPQDPTVFSGTLRFNLDPWNTKTDDDLWWALRHAHLHALASSWPAGLEFQVGQEGQNLSVGQRQLVCLARALLRKSKVLVLDEATAAVDVETDELIQASIRREFSHATVITIAHRINTVVDYNRVMVLSDGMVKEIGDPQTLLQDANSEFRALAMKSAQKAQTAGTTKKDL